MKYIGENSIKKLISLIKGDLAKKQDSITATGILERDTDGAISGIETVGATLVETQEATLVDVPNGLLKGDGTSISAAVAGTDYAPGGYGLGGAGKLLTRDDDLDNISGGGWYFWYSGDGDFGIPANSPNNLTYCAMRVDSGYNNNGMWCQQTIRKSGCELVRWKSDTKGWQPWEWVNPPMQLGTEYRMTERVAGKPVYTKLVDFGALPNATSKQVAFANSIGCHPIRVSAYVYQIDSTARYEVINGGCLPTSFGNPGSNDIWLTAFQLGNIAPQIYMYSSKNLSTRSAYVQVWYVKNSD